MSFVQPQQRTALSIPEKAASGQQLVGIVRLIGAAGPTAWRSVGLATVLAMVAPFIGLAPSSIITINNLCPWMLDKTGINSKYTAFASRFTTIEEINFAG